VGGGEPLRAGGTVGAERAARAPAETDTRLLSGGIANARHRDSALYSKLGLRLRCATSPVSIEKSAYAERADRQSVTAGAPASRSSSRLAKAAQAQLDSGSPGIGTCRMLTWSSFKLMSGIDLVHIHTREMRRLATCSAALPVDVSINLPAP